jgi:hypothetical protein
MSIEIMEEVRMIERATVAVLCRLVRLLRKTFIAGTLLSTIAMIATASAQSDYPNRPVQLIRPSRKAVSKTLKS